MYGFSIKKQGVYSAGGSVQQAEGTFDPIAQWQPEGQTRHSDHANVFYQIPEEGKGQSIMYLHGAGQSRNGWISTPDGRDSLANIFLSRGYSSYLVDQPRRASAGQSSVAAEISAVPDDQSWYTQFRMGLWPQLQDGIQFDRSEETLNQFFRQYTPDTGEFDDAPSSVPAWDFWRAGVAMAHKFADYANARGGDVTIYELPREGMTGNSHFMFQELNNREVADHIEGWLKAKTTGK